jgi:hypothetical protein
MGTSGVRSIARRDGRVNGCRCGQEVAPRLPPASVVADARSARDRRGARGTVDGTRAAASPRVQTSIRKTLMGALLASGAVAVAGCSSGLGAPSSNVVEAQVDYNMVVADDRAKFRAEDLAYEGSVGPYAVYKVTGASPKLIGPYVKAPAGFHYAMACGATHYFSAVNAALAPSVGLQFHGGRLGQEVLVDAPQAPQDDGGCTTPQDSFGTPLPDGGDGSGGSGGAGGGNIGGTPGDGEGGDTGVQQIGITVTPTPPTGSTVLIRRVAITDYQQHNGSHVEPNICCTGDNCTIQ